MKIVFDKGSERQRAIDVNRISENPVELVLTGVYDTVIEQPGDFPDITTFVHNQMFTTIDVISDDGMVIPICSGYNYIQEISTNYYERGKSYSLIMTITRVEIIDTVVENLDGDGE